MKNLADQKTKVNLEVPRNTTEEKAIAWAKGGKPTNQQGKTKPDLRIEEARDNAEQWLTELYQLNPQVAAEVVSNYQPKGQPSKKTPALVSISASTVKPKKVEWLWEEYIPGGKLSELLGDPDLGKSTVLLDLAARVSTHGIMPDNTQGATGHVLILTCEDDYDDTVVPRLIAAGADLNRITFLEEIGGVPLVIPRDLKPIEEKIQELDAKLLIIEPLSAFLDASMRDEQEVRRALHQLKRSCKETGCAGNFLRHLNKGGGMNPIYRGGGSIGITAATRAGLLVAMDPDYPEQRILAQMKRNLAKGKPSLAFKLAPVEPFGVCKVEWCGTSPLTHRDLLQLPKSEEEKEAKAAAKSKLEEAKEFLTTELSDGPKPSTEIIKEARQQLNISQRTLEDAKKLLGVVSRKIGDGWKWFLE